MPDMHKHKVTVVLEDGEVLTELVVTERQDPRGVRQLLANDYDKDGLLQLDTRLIPWANISHVQVEYDSLRG